MTICPCGRPEHRVKHSARLAAYNLCGCEEACKPPSGAPTQIQLDLPPARSSMRSSRAAVLQ